MRLNNRGVIGCANSAHSGGPRGNCKFHINETQTETFVLLHDL